MQLWKQRFATKLVSAEEAVTHLKNGDRIYRWEYVFGTWHNNQGDGKYRVFRIS